MGGGEVYFQVHSLFQCSFANFNLKNLEENEYKGY